MGPSKRSLALANSWKVGLAGLAVLGLVGDAPIRAQSGTYDCPNLPSNPNSPPPLGPTDIVSFSAGSLIIPMGVCYQPMDGMDTDLRTAAVQESYGSSATLASAFCASSDNNDDGMVAGHALVQRLVEDGVPVHWSIRHGKEGWSAEDFAIAGTVTDPPVSELDPQSNSVDSTAFLGLPTIRYSGAPMIIDSADAATARTLIAGYMSANAGLRKAEVHVAETSFQAPIYRTLTSMPKVAVVDFHNQDFSAAESLFRGSTNDAEMDATAQSWWDYVGSRDVASGDLITHGYHLVWIPEFSKNGPLDGHERAFVDALEAFADSGGHLVIHGESIALLEGEGTFDSSTGVWTRDQTTKVNSSFQHANEGLVFDFFSGAYGNNDTDELTEGEDYSDPAGQWGGAAWTGIGGAKTDWSARCDRSYRDRVRRLIYSAPQGSSTAVAGVEFAAWKHYDGDTSKGRVYYLGGNNWRKGTYTGFRMLLNTIFAAPGGGGGGATPTLVSRSAPLAALVDGTETHYQGFTEYEQTVSAATTYGGSGDDSTFVFPDRVGHLFAWDLPSFQTATETDPNDPDFDVIELWDAADGIPAVNPAGCGIDVNTSITNTTCRSVLTTTDDATLIEMNTGAVSSLKPLLDASLSDTDAQTLISRILAGRPDGSGGYEPALGGVDRSSLAVVKNSSTINNGRATIAYFGAADGMLHAVCADTAASYCTARGQELWAFMPRNQLPLVTMNQQIIDGSPTVADVLGDWGGTNKEFRTVMVFQTGSGDTGDPDAVPAVYAMDITDPSNPSIIWVRKANVGALGTSDLGIGVTTAMAPTRIDGDFKNLTYIVTSNGGTGGAGIYAEAVDTITGEVKWTWSHTYPESRLAANPEIPDTPRAIPGGATVISSTGGLGVDTVIIPTIYGQIYALDATTGANKYGSGPLFDYGEDFHPIGARISLIQASDGLRMLFGTGGYVDPRGSDWAPASVQQSFINAPLAPDPTEVPLDLTSSSVQQVPLSCSGGICERVYSQVIVSGTDVLFTSTDQDLNPSSYRTANNKLHSYSLGGTSVTVNTPTSIIGGAAGVDVSETTGTVAGSPSTAPLTSAGESVGTVDTLSESFRDLWLRTR